MFCKNAFFQEKCRGVFSLHPVILGSVRVEPGGLHPVIPDSVRVEPGGLHPVIPDSVHLEPENLHPVIPDTWDMYGTTIE